MDERIIEFSFGANFAAVDGTRVEICEFLDKAYGDTGVKSEIEDFSIAVTEAMNNVIEHSGAASIKSELFAGRSEIIFRMYSKGNKFDPTVNIAMPDLDETDDLPEGGFGLAIMRELLDSVYYEYEDGVNILTLKKKLLNRPTREEKMEISLVMEGDTALLELNGDLVASAVEEFKAGIAELQRKNCVNVVLQMAKVNFMDSSGLGACMAISKALSAKKGMLVCAEQGETVKKIFHITGADRKIKVVASTSEGLGAIREKMGNVTL